MKTINEYVSYNKAISSIDEYLLSKSKKQLSKAERDELVNKLYDEYGTQYGEFSRIKNDGTFYTIVYDYKKEFENDFPSKIVKLAKVEKHQQGSNEIRCTLNIDDVLEVYDYNCEKVYKLIKKWFDYL